jgi:hypothetical protein
MSINRFNLSVLSLCAALCLPVLPVEAADTEDQIKAARQKINVSGRQRMLSQRMTSAVCLAVVGANPDMRSEVALTSWNDFEKALAGLKDGDSSLGLTPEPNAPIRAGLEVVEGTWAEFAPAVQQLLAGDLSSTTISTILSLNTQLLSQSNDVVSMFEKSYGAGVIDPGTAVSINVAGRQRMLSQKMTKELCFIAADFDREKHIEALTGTVSLFDVSLQHLTNGDIASDILPPPNVDIVVQLGVVADLWDKVRPKMQAVIDNGSVGIEELSETAALTDQMLAEMHKAVLLYVSNNS